MSRYDDCFNCSLIYDLSRLCKDWHNLGSSHVHIPASSLNCNYCNVNIDLKPWANAAYARDVLLKVGSERLISRVFSHSILTLLMLVP